jgi:hypothetical protein
MGGRGRKASDQITGFQRGTRSSYLAARLKRDAPEIAAAAERGEYRSVRAAARAAGIIKPPDAYRELCAVGVRLTMYRVLGIGRG